MATDYGTDCDAYLDIPKIHTLTSGPRNVMNAIARRLQTPFGGLAYIGGDPLYGFDVRALLNAAFTAQTKATAESQIQRQCEMDERVSTADVTVAFVFSTSSLTISITLTLVDGETFSFVLGVSQVTVEILEA